MVAVIAPSRTAAVQLADAHRLVDPALRAAIDTLPSSMRRIAGYHLGWWSPDGAPGRADPDPALRPALVFGGALAAGGSDLDAVAGAVAVELVHNFALLHAALLHAAPPRGALPGIAAGRRRPAAWRVFGTGPAMLAGDALLALAMDVLAAAGPPAATRAAGMLGAAVQRLLEGHGADLAFDRRADVGVEECQATAAAKTGALFGCACAMGALFGGGRPAQVLRLAQFGEDAGLAHQFADDLLGIWGDPDLAGRPAHSDLLTRRRSLPVVAALNSGTAAGSALAAAYAGPAPADLAPEAALVEASGARLWAQARADELLARATEALAAAEPDPRTEAELVALARLAAHRDR
jgi:geranylgeranyl diphosphate synthase type I